MIKILKYSSLLIVFFFTGCLFTEPINEKVNSNFSYSGDFLVNTPVSLQYKDIDEKTSDMVLTWQIEEVPPYSVMEENSFLPSNDINRRVFIPDIPGIYTVSLSVEDKYHAKSITRKTIQIKNNLPIAVIKSLNNNNFITDKEIFFDASDSYDIDYNKITSFSWSIISAPKGSNVLYETSNDEDFSIKPDIYGDYTIKLVIKDINEDENYTTYSFHVYKATNPKILKTSPDSSIALIPIKETLSQEIYAIVTDDITASSKLNYFWSISINNEDFFNISNTNRLVLNGNLYGIGDLILIKLRVVNSANNYAEVLWRFVIIE